MLKTGNEIRLIYLNMQVEQVRMIKFWLHRTSVLWNAIIENLGTYPTTYLAEPDSNESDAHMESIIDTIRLLLVDDKKDILPDFTPNRKWHRPLEQVRELPKPIIDNRISDIKRCYRGTKQRKQSNPKNSLNIPSVKSRLSNQSVRFNQEHFSIKGDTVTIHGAHGFTIKHPELLTIDPTQVKNVSITKKKLTPDVRGEWALDGGSRGYCLTIFS